MTASNDQITQGQYWSELAAKAQAGDQKSYRLLLKDILPFIQNVLRGRLSNPDWADDVTQDVLMSIHRSLHTYSPDRSFRPWLMAIVDFRKTDYLRKHYRQLKKKEAFSSDGHFLDSHVTKATNSGELKDIENALESLPDKQRDVFRLVKIEGYSIQEVAKKMDMSESSVKVTAHRASKKLQGLLK